MDAELITIGDELLIGQIINTNAAFIGESLAAAGLRLRRATTVGDERERILRAFRLAWEENDVVLTTGGLGPTHDDMTRAAVVEFFGTKLVTDPEVLADVRRFFASRGRRIQPINEEQALVPEIAAAIRNPVGTAPGFRIEREGKYFFVMPGVPAEMRTMMQEQVMPFLSGLSGETIRSLTLQTTGMYESNLALALGDVRELAGDGSLAFLPGINGVRIRITVAAESPAAADARLGEIRDRILGRIGAFVYGFGEQEIEEVIGAILRERGLTLALAESCTGGLVSHRITNVPGSSVYFLRGYVTYGNSAKVELLGVPADAIDRHGAVSRETAEAMAEGARKRSGASIGLSVTGIAGPDGATESKPLGLVWIGYSDGRETRAHRFVFGDRRLRNKERFAQTALEILRRKLLGLAVELY